MRWKFERVNFETFKCCFCLHVRTGALLLGLFHLVGYVCLISMLIVAVLNPEWIQAYIPGLLEPSSDFSFGLTNNSDSSQDIWLYTNSQATWLYTRDLLSDNLVISILLSFGSLSITICLIYGTIMVRSQFVTPFFCIQVFELCVAGMMMLSCFSNIPDLKKWIATQEKLPFRDAVLRMDNDHLNLIVFVIFVLVLSIKMYFIGIVWACYKYLRQLEVDVRQTRVRIYGRETELNLEDTEMLLPPKYEDVLQMPDPQSSSPPPPAYTEQ